MAFGLTTSSIEKKVREATRDDGWKPSERVLMEIADATHSYKHLPIIMNIIWKRLNDHNRNWKKLYKGLLVLEYILKHGSEQVRVEVQVRKVEVQTLTMFQHGKTFDGKDIGLHVRDKAKEILEWLEANPPGSSKKQPAAKASSSSSSQPAHQQVPLYNTSPTPVPLHFQPQPVPVPVPQPGYAPQPQPVAIHPSAFGPPQPMPGYAPQPQPVPLPVPQPSFNQNIPALPPKPQPSIPPQPAPQQFSAPPPSADPFGASRNTGGFDPFESSPDDPFARASKAPPQSPYAYQQNQNPFASP